MTEEIKPCPMCGGPAEIWNAHDNRPAWIACMGRCAVLISKEYKTDAEAVTDWNRRAPVRIKPLEWGPGEPSQSRALSIVGEFVCTELGGVWHHQGERFESRQGAQSAAQADYERRIREALE